jgi:mono/diheme cytochrome c family protein
MRFLFGIVVGAVGLVVGGYFFATSGKISVAATEHGSVYAIVDTFLSKVSDKSVEKHALAKTNPFGQDPAAARAGMLHYRENCILCHGARDVDTSEFAKGLSPGAPMLDMKDVQEMSDGQLFWVISNGIRSTGMPAFSPTHKEEEIWKIVAFVRRLPKLTPEEIAQLNAGREAPEEHHHEAAEADAPSTHAHPAKRK